MRSAFSLGASLGENQLAFEDPTTAGEGSMLGCTSQAEVCGDVASDPTTFAIDDAKDADASRASVLQSRVAWGNSKRGG